MSSSLETLQIELVLRELKCHPESERIGHKTSGYKGCRQQFCCDTRTGVVWIRDNIADAYIYERYLASCESESLCTMTHVICDRS